MMRDDLRILDDALALMGLDDYLERAEGDEGMIVEVEFFNVGKGARTWKSGFVGGFPTADDLLRQVRSMAHVPDGVAVEWSLVTPGAGRLLVAKQEVGTFRTIRNSPT